MSVLNTYSNPERDAMEKLLLVGRQDKVTIGAPRASEIYSDCMRKRVLGKIYHLEETRNIGIGGNITFGLGTAVHNYLQDSNWIFGPEKRGFWECMACGRISPFGPFPNGKCSCDSRKTAYRYKEFGARIKEPVEFTLHIDMFIEQGSQLNLYEFKTMSGKDFNTLESPLASHVYQVHCYMYACTKFRKRIFKNLDYKHAYILYISKKHVVKGIPLKLFCVNIDDKITAAIVEKLMLYKKGISSFPDNLPNCVKRCNAPQYNTYSAKICPAMQKCFEFYNKGRR